MARTVEDAVAVFQVIVGEDPDDPITLTREYVQPGLRPAGADVADQKRVVTPRKALDDGASILVIGRPVTAAADPAQAIRDIAASLNKEVIE